MVSRVILIIAVAWALFAQAAEAQEVGPIKVLRYDSEVAVEELLVYGRFVNGAELKCVYELLGVEPEKTAAEKNQASKELFIMLRIQATDKAQGALHWIELEVANDSPLLRGRPRLKVPTVFGTGRFLVIQKLCEASDPRDGSVPGLGEASTQLFDESTDYVENLHGEAPVLRLRSMVTK